MHINELKKHKVKLQEKDRNSTEKDHQTIIEKEKEIRKLKLQNIKAENKRREKKEKSLYLKNVTMEKENLDMVRRIYYIIYWGNYLAHINM